MNIILLMFFSIFREFIRTSLRYNYVLRLSWTTLLKNLHDFYWSFPVLNGRAQAMIKLPTSFHMGKFLPPIVGVVTKNHYFFGFSWISTVRFRIKTPPKSQVLATNPDLPSSPMGHTPGPGPVCVERAPCEVFTSGTLVDPELLQGVTKNFPKKPRSSRVG